MDEEIICNHRERERGVRRLEVGWGQGVALANRLTERREGNTRRLDRIGRSDETIYKTHISVVC